MSAHGQFCSVARALDALGGRWTLLVVREVLCGARRFNDIRRGIPRISKTMLTERLGELVAAGVLRRVAGDHGPEYELTPAGQDLAALIGALGTWGQRWLKRDARREDVDLEPLLLDLQRRARLDALPASPLVLRIEVKGHAPHFLLLRRGEAALCAENPGFPEPLVLCTPLPALTAWWRGDVDLAGARRMGLSLEGPRAMVRAFPTWFDRYLFAPVAPARQAA